MILAIKWTEDGRWSENMQIRASDIQRYRDSGWDIVETPYRPGLYTSRDAFMETAKKYDER